MGDPLHELEKKLERLVPHGLSDQGRDRLEGKIDELAAEVEVARSPWPWLRLSGIAAAIALVATVLVVSGVPGPGRDDAVGREAPAEVPAEDVESEMERLEYRREFGAPEDHRIVVTRFNEPMHSWNYKVREVELILDPVTGLRVELVTEHEEEVRTAVTSF